MQNTEIKIGTWWVYIGPVYGRGIKHKVLSVEPNEVVTWSDMTDPGSNGYSWLGEHNEFRSSFRPCA